MPKYDIGDPDHWIISREDDKLGRWGAIYQIETNNDHDIDPGVIETYLYNDLGEIIEMRMLVVDYDQSIEYVFHYEYDLQGNATHWINGKIIRQKIAAIRT